MIQHPSLLEVVHCGTSLIFTPFVLEKHEFVFVQTSDIDQIETSMSNMETNATISKYCGRVPMHQDQHNQQDRNQYMCQAINNQISKMETKTTMHMWEGT